MIKVLLVKKGYPEEEAVWEELKKSGYLIEIYEFRAQTDEELQTEYIDFVKALRSKVYHMIVSVNYDEILANAGYYGGTKYVAFQWDLSEGALSSVYINYVTNYIILNDLLPYIQFRKAGITTVHYCPFDRKEICRTVFSDKEQEIYQTFFKLQDLRNQNGNESKSKKLEDIYAASAREKECIFCLKEQCMEYVDSLISKKETAAWEELVVLFYGGIGREVSGSFWEFYLLKILVQVYEKERQNSGAFSQTIEMLQFESVQELLNIYFKLLFLLRRLEYDVAAESHMETVWFIKQYALSDYFLKAVFENGKIYDKNKVINKLKKLWKEYEDEGK